MVTVHVPDYTCVSRKKKKDERSFSALLLTQLVIFFSLTVVVGCVDSIQVHVNL